jgi:surfactin synthase thioesterase subunit
MEDWRQHSSVDSNLHVFQAGHFFIRSDLDSVVDTLKTILPLSQAGMASAPHA